MTDIILNLPDGPAVPESMEPAAIPPPTRRQLMMLASDMGMASIDEAVMKFALAALARWGIRQGILDSSITPPPELVEEWIAQVWHEGTPVRVAASDLHVAAQAARWGAAAAPAVVPVAVSERLPGPSDCDAEGFCWFWSPEDQCWFWERIDSAFCRRYGAEFDWLPAHALPLPSGEAQP